MHFATSLPQNLLDCHVIPDKFGMVVVDTDQWPFHPFQFIPKYFFPCFIHLMLLPFSKNRTQKNVPIQPASRKLNIDHFLCSFTDQVTIIMRQTKYLGSTDFQWEIEWAQCTACLTNSWSFPPHCTVCRISRSTGHVVCFTQSWCA